MYFIYKYLSIDNSSSNIDILQEHSREDDLSHFLNSATDEDFVLNNVNEVNEFIIETISKQTLPTNGFFDLSEHEDSFVQTPHNNSMKNENESLGCEIQQDTNKIKGNIESCIQLI